MTKKKTPGRTKLNCTKCGDSFSTHSSDRELCHRCKPKCREIHYFDPATKARIAEREADRLAALAARAKPAEAAA